MKTDRATHTVNADKPRLLGVSEICALLNVQRMTLKRLRDAGNFPDPLAELNAGPVWDEGVIKEWQTSHRP